LYETREQKAVLEARNGLLLFEAVARIVEEAQSGFKLTPDILLDLHRLAIHDIYICAGKFRTSNVVLGRNGVIDNEKHQPPEWERVENFVVEMCQYVNENFGKSGVHLASYIMWRHNWIHPFKGGNGRTSRALSYLLLNVRLGFNLPGENTIAQQIETDRGPYYGALEAADIADKQGVLDVSTMEELISNMLAAQLLSVHQRAVGK
jgi:Fic family protein